MVDFDIYDILTALAVNPIPNVSEQLNLFNLGPAYQVEQPKELMSFEALLKWKSRVFKHQQCTLNTELPYAKRYAKALKDSLWSH